MPTVLTVSQLNAYVKSLLDGDFNLNEVYICGEISNFTNHYRTGHLYFTLKDGSACVKAVMFRSSAQRLRFAPQDGLRVIVRGSVSLYERDGSFQLYADDMQPDGLGALNLAFEQLKKKLSEKGMFDDEHKKPLPDYPERIAVVTSPTGAAIRDIINVLGRRFPCAQVIIVPVLVQGEAAPAQIAAAIEKINELACADVIIAGRGGGSIEDLWAFNDERVAQAIYDSDIPIISAVGHETDYTIADFVSDVRAPTPSAAAELAVPDVRNVLSDIDGLLECAYAGLYESTASERDRLARLGQRLSVVSPQAHVKQCAAGLDVLSHRLISAQSALFSSYKKRLAVACAGLDALSPLRVLARGYAMVLDGDGSPVRSIEKLNVGDSLNIKLSDGSIGCRVTDV